MGEKNILIYSVAFIFCLIATVFAERMLIPVLSGKASQPIFAEGPNWHLSKSGTPTMGGLAFIASSVITIVGGALYLHFFSDSYFSLSLILILLYGIANAIIGIIDDTTKVKRKENAGLTPIQKLIFQTVAAAFYLLSRKILLGEVEYITFSAGSFDLGAIYFPLSLVMLVGTVNAANLTDGIDGLASGVSFSAAAGLALISTGTSYDVGFISFALMGATVGFLVFNIHPAKIFMGDTGSLYLGSLIAAACVSLGNPLIILVVGAVYFIEALSVIIQVAVYKLTHKRVFKMAPLHHHFEKCGWSENKIVICAIIFTVILTVILSPLFV